MIGFVGLVVLHLVRLWIGPDHRWLLPGSALLGASLLPNRRRFGGAPNRHIHCGVWRTFFPPVAGARAAIRNLDMREIAKQVLKAAQLTYRVGSRPLVSEIDFALRSGEVVAMLGPNGAGKSTILKLLSGQLRPSSGTVIFGDKPLQQWPPRELARRRAVLPQHGMVPFEFSALEIVLLGRSPHGDGRSCLTMALEAMEWTECRHLAEQSVKTLSGGELQRVHLARVLVQIGLRARS